LILKDRLDKQTDHSSVMTFCPPRNVTINVGLLWEV